MNYRPLIREISQQTGVEFRPASPAALSALEELGAPAFVREFYSEFEPSVLVQGPMRLWPINEIIYENRELFPGRYCSPHGFIVFASSYGGDAYCFDALNQDESTSNIVRFIINSEISENSNRAQLAKIMEHVATNLFDFLEKFAGDGFDEDGL